MASDFEIALELMREVRKTGLIRYAAYKPPLTNAEVLRLRSEFKDYNFFELRRLFPHKQEEIK
jgi:hypothetical protein